MRTSGKVSAAPVWQGYCPSSLTEVLFQKANDIFSLRLSIFVLMLSSYVNIWTECFFEMSKIKNRCRDWMWIVREGRKCFNTSNSVNLCLFLFLSQARSVWVISWDQPNPWLGCWWKEVNWHRVAFAFAPCPLVLTSVNSFSWLILSCI